MSAERGWIVEPPPRGRGFSSEEEKRELLERLRRRYAYLRNRPLPSYIADMRKRVKEQHGRKR